MQSLIEHPQVIFEISTPDQFNGLALQLFHFQYKNSTIYKAFVDLLGLNPQKVSTPDSIPYLPIEFFKSHRVYLDNAPEPTLMFESSGTTGSENSKHYLSNPDLYLNSIKKGFEKAFGNIEDYTFLCLMPSYLERPNSSLIFMLDHLVKMTSGNGSGFFLYDYDKLAVSLKEACANGKNVILWGVTFALLDFIEKYRFELPDLLIIETGGMKGRREEMIRDELHDRLRKGFGVQNVFSEYGMTELLSQCYLNKDALFVPPPWMHISIRDINDPLSPARKGKTGGINIIDLANRDSCAFIATQDLGRMHEGGFEVLGRFDDSDVRGCNLLL